MDLAVIGISHQQAPIDIREAVTFTESKKLKSISMLLDMGIEEVIIIATCNRSEIYVCSHQIDESIKKVKQFFKTYSKLEVISNYVFIKKNEKAIRHLFRVSSGLDSLILGEDQILGQVKTAHELALSIGSSRKVLNRLFQQSIVTSKTVKTKTKISHHPISMSYIAIQFLKEKLVTLKNKKVLIIGTGEISTLAISYLVREEMGAIYVASRKLEKSRKLQHKYIDIVPIDYELRYTMINEVDIVLSATGAPHLVLEKNKFPKLSRPLIVMDIAMPRDVDPHITNINHVSLYNMDVLKNIQLANIESRKKLACSAQGIIDKEVIAFMEWLELSTIDPTIKSLNDRCQEIREQSLDYLFRRLELSAKEKKLIDGVVESALKRLVREPIINLKKIKDKDKRNECIKIVDELFKI